MAFSTYDKTLAVKFVATELLQPRPRQWQKTETKIRVRPTVQMQYRRGYLKQGEYTVEEQCDLPVSNQGPAAGEVHNDTANQGPECEKV